MNQNKGGRPPSISATEIFAAADKVASTGKEPDYNSVRPLLGSGTRPVIQRELIAWQVARDGSGAADMPADILDLLKRAYKRAHATGRADAQQQIESLRNGVVQAADDQESAESTLIESQAARVELQSKLSEMLGENQARRDEIDRLLLDASQARTDRDEALRAAAHTEKLHELATQAAAKLEVELEQVSSDRDQQREQKHAVEIKLAERTVAHDALVDRCSGLLERNLELTDRLRSVECQPPQHGGFADGLLG